MTNRQPFYHRATVLFTGAGYALSEDEFWKVLRKALPKRRFPVIEIEEYDEPEPGDPADLTGGEDG